VEAFDLANGDLTKVPVGRVAQYLSEEMNSLLVIEKEMFSSLAICSGACIAMFVDPLKEDGLIYIRVGLLNKHLPKPIDVFCAQGNLVLRTDDEEF
jgi:hypothetical protein